MNCKEIHDLLPAYNDAALSASQTDEIHSHLASCGACHRESRLLLAAWDMLRALEPIEPSPNFRAQFWEKVRQDEAKKTLWFAFPRLVPAAASVLAIWFLGITSGLALFERHAERTPSSTGMGVRVFTSPYPLNSIEQIYLQGPPAGPAGAPTPISSRRTV